MPNNRATFWTTQNPTPDWEAVYEMAWVGIWAQAWREPVIFNVLARRCGCTWSEFFDPPRKDMAPFLAMGGPNRVLLAFPGTQTDEQMFRYMLPPGCYSEYVDALKGRVQKAYLDMWSETLPVLQGMLERNRQAPGSDVCLIGHSMGGALAAVAALMFKDSRRLIPKNVLCTGTPKIGNATIAFKTNSPEFLHVRNLGDPIPTFPPTVITSWQSPTTQVVVRQNFDFQPADPNWVFEDGSHLPSLRYWRAGRDELRIDLSLFPLLRDPFRIVGRDIDFHKRNHDLVPYRVNLLRAAQTQGKGQIDAEMFALQHAWALMETLPSKERLIGPNRWDGLLDAAQQIFARATPAPVFPAPPEPNRGFLELRAIAEQEWNELVHNAQGWAVDVNPPPADNAPAPGNALEFIVTDAEFVSADAAETGYLDEVATTFMDLQTIQAAIYSATGSATGVASSQARQNWLFKGTDRRILEKAHKVLHMIGARDALAAATPETSAISTRTAMINQGSPAITFAFSAILWRIYDLLRLTRE